MESCPLDQVIKLILDVMVIVAGIQISDWISRCREEKQDNESRSQSQSPSDPNQDGSS